MENTTTAMEESPRRRRGLCRTAIFLAGTTATVVVLMLCGVYYKSRCIDNNDNNNTFFDPQQEHLPPATTMASLLRGDSTTAATIQVSLGDTIRDRGVLVRSSVHGPAKTAAGPATRTMEEPFPSASTRKQRIAPPYNRSTRQKGTTLARQRQRELHSGKGTYYGSTTGAAAVPPGLDCDTVRPCIRRAQFTSLLTPLLTPLLTHSLTH